MKKITLLLVFVPIFLMTALNFSGGDATNEHPPYLKGFTCSSCHATIIDGIIIKGKTSDDLSNVKVTIELPDYISFTAVQVDLKDIKKTKKANFPIYKEDDYGTIYNATAENNLNGKKGNMLTFEISMEEFEDNREIEIQGLLTNGDGTSKGDFSFSEKIVLEEKISIIESKPLRVFPTIANSQVTIKDGKENSLFSVLDISGKLVYQNIISSQEEIIDVSNFENGYYFIKTDLEESFSTTKFIVSK